ncbi:DUF1403 family protein [Mesorhizobium shangrilense]|uniref:DUF1403 family protein n=1 Tax=Mesorhizobium shangrilense TaxID=460060 RepID=A0ABV2DN47_9HYPH
MIRADPLPSASPLLPRVPAWALPDGPVEHQPDAAFYAGAALTSLDQLVRSDPPWAGAWRQRLALKSAVAAVRLAGRGEDEAALRDVWHLRQPGADPGPAGTILDAWRRLASQPPVIDGERLVKVVELLGLRWDDAFADLPGMIGDVLGERRPAPFAAAAIASHVIALSPGSEVLAWWLADMVVAQNLRWPRPVPLLMAQAFAPALRSQGTRAVCLAVAQGAAESCRLGTELGRRADRLMAVAPKLRAKGAGEVIFLLLNEDAVSGSLVTKNLSRFGARRLFERLQKFEAVRELSGRPTFRLFGL